MTAASACGISATDLATMMAANITSTADQNQAGDGTIHDGFLP